MLDAIHETLKSQKGTTMVRLCVLFVIIAPVFIQVASGQQKGIGVRVEHSGNDRVGQQLAYALREAVRSSHGYRLEQEGLFTIHLITLDPETRRTTEGYWTVAAVVITMQNLLPFKEGNPQTWLPFYITSLVLTVGNQVVDEQARSIMASLDEVVQKMERSVRGY
ncbi:MAG: hypothetical protein HRF44_10840 [Ignavibacterium sp.]|jgi:hypothetical protein